MMLQFRKHLKNLTSNVYFFVFVIILSRLKIILLKTKSFEMRLKNLKCH